MSKRPKKGSKTRRRKGVPAGAASRVPNSQPSGNLSAAIDSEPQIDGSEPRTASGDALNVPDPEFRTISLLATPTEIPIDTTSKNWELFQRWVPLICLIFAGCLWIAGNLAVFGWHGPDNLNESNGPGIINDLNSLKSMLIYQTPNRGDTQEALEQSRNLAILNLRDATARNAWMITLVLQTVAFGFAISFYVRRIWNNKATKSMFWPMLCIITTFAMIAIPAGLYYSKGYPIDRVFGFGFAYTSILHDLMMIHFEDPWIKAVVIFETGLAILVIGLGTFAACVTIVDPEPGMRQNEKILRERLVQLRQMLTVSTTVLIVGVVQISAEFRWPAAAFPEKVPTISQPKSLLGKLIDKATKSDDKPALPLTETLLSYAASVTFVAGGSFTLFMIAVYGSSFLLLDWKAHKLAERRDDLALTEVEWRKKNGISLEWSELYADISKIIDPLVVAALSSFIKF